MIQNAMFFLHYLGFYFPERAKIPPKSSHKILWTTLFETILSDVTCMLYPPLICHHSCGSHHNWLWDCRWVCKSSVKQKANTGNSSFIIVVAVTMAEALWSLWMFTVSYFAHPITFFPTIISQKSKINFVSRGFTSNTFPSNHFWTLTFFESGYPNL